MREAGHIAGDWTGSAGRPGTKTVEPEPDPDRAGQVDDELHRQTAEEEIFFVLRRLGHLPARGLARSRSGRETASSTACVRRTPCVRATTGSTCSRSGTRGSRRGGRLPRGGIWLDGRYLGQTSARGYHPVGTRSRRWRAGVAGGRRAAESVVDSTRSRATRWRALVTAGAKGGRGAERAQLGTCSPGEEGGLLHCHSGDEEIFVVLEGEGSSSLAVAAAGPGRQTSRGAADPRGHVISRGVAAGSPWNRRGRGAE